uniref:Leucine rich repeat containing 34 n=1 Tax=Fundulus heteroclitus TaxID=8078 RepID=A0A3Q2P0Z6_FUNHE
MAAESVSERYRAVCGQQGVKINPLVLEKLEKSSTTRSFTLKLAGSSEQKLCDDDVSALSKCLQDNRTVTGLDLRYNNITDGGIGHLEELLEVEDSPLRSLDLTFNDIQADGAEVLAACLQGNNTLLSLRLSGNKLGNTGAMRLAQMLQVNRTLQELQLADCDLETPAVIALAIALKHNPVLRSVDLSRPLLFSLQEEWAVHFSEMFGVNGRLAELHLGKMGLTDTGVERLAEGLKQNRSLRYLDLRCNHVTHDGAQHLAGVLRHNTSLQVLDLSANRIEDVGAEHLSGALSWPGCVLTELSVCRNNIRTKGLLSVAQALVNNPTLTHVYIWGNHPEEPACLAFRELISSGRLSPQHTDVRPYQVDGHVFLAEVWQSLRKHVYSADGDGQDSDDAAAPDEPDPRPDCSS